MALNIISTPIKAVINNQLCCGFMASHRQAISKSNRPIKIFQPAPLCLRV
ncbi:hypothetical protein UUU_37490 [Klebsiella pneumoniae subsp. pneumoniae DSM 30104 = JCM 1662 = NBRC 14940]|nr:hypothetical protein UUU_37490 [Klebsiella pneumoniae subsp. pneumoniae DSM 30104 = JCM 1662 = NBRC 14940]